MHTFEWWQSQEIVARLCTTAAILVIIFSGLGLVFKWQSDRLKKQAELEIQDKLKIASDKLFDSEKQIEILKKETITAQKSIEDVKNRTQKATQGILSTYDFNGIKRDNTPGRFTATMGEETAVFQRIVSLEKERNYNELSKLCKDQIIKTPEWLTPYLFLGIAEANLGHKDAAILQFKHVIDIAPDNPDYKQAKDFMNKLINK